MYASAEKRVCTWRSPKYGVRSGVTLAHGSRVSVRGKGREAARAVAAASTRNTMGAIRERARNVRSLVRRRCRRRPTRRGKGSQSGAAGVRRAANTRSPVTGSPLESRSEEHTSELQSLRHLVCRLLLEKKK